MPRNECLILENPTGTVLPADDFNRWRRGSNTYSTGFQQLALDALWYIDPDAGVNGVWDNALAAEKPIYNADFTQMTVKLRQGLYWSDGVEFTADDLFYTVDVQMKTPGFNYTGQFHGQYRPYGTTRQIYGRLLPESAQLALPLCLHRALGRRAS